MHGFLLLEVALRCGTYQLLALWLQDPLPWQYSKLPKPCPSSRHQACFGTCAACAAAATATAVSIRASASCNSCSSAESAGCCCCTMVVGSSSTCCDRKVHWRVTMVCQAQGLVHCLSKVAGWEADAVCAEGDLRGQLWVQGGKCVATGLHRDTSTLHSVGASASHIVTIVLPLPILSQNTADPHMHCRGMSCLCARG